MRITVLLIVIGLSLFVPLYGFVVLVGLYTLRWFGIELMILACILDIYFGTHVLPLYLLSAAATIMVIELIKPKFSFSIE